MQVRIPVTFAPSDLTAWVEPGQTVLAAGRAAGVNISAPCGGRGVCGACGVRVIEGELAPATRDELEALKRAPAGVRLACRALVTDAVTVRPVVVNSTLSRREAPLAGTSDLVMGVDLGTTTVSAIAVEAATGRQVGVSTVLNRQQSYGADILSRISSALEGSGAALQDLAESSVLDAIDTAAPGARARLKRVVIAANVAMATLLSGADPTSLASHPFSPPGGCDVVPLESRLASLLPNAVIELVPAVGGFVGGDVLAGLLAVGEAGAERPYLLVDIGTNAEVAVVRQGRVWVTSAAAGPAFEGGGISCGGPAAPEAVVGVEIGGEGTVRLLGTDGVTPSWFSGAGLVSAVAQLRRAGHLDADGRMTVEGPLRERFAVGNDGVLGVGLGDPAGCLVVTQRDVRELQLAKAAVQVAIAEVLRRGDVSASRLDAVYVAGAFGAALSRDDLVELGVVPRQAADVVVQAGNTSLRGATALAFDPSAIDSAGEIVERTHVIDLAADPDFADRLLEALKLAPFSA